MHHDHQHASFPAPCARATVATSTRGGGTLRRALLASAIAGAMLSPSAFALNYEVSNTHDAGSGSLRDALNQANSTVGVADTITFAANVTGTIALTSGSLYATDEVDIQGPGADQLSIDGSGLVAYDANAENRGRGPGGAILVTGNMQQPQGPQGGPAPPTIPVALSGLTLTGAPVSAITAKYTDLTVSDAVITGNGSLTQQATPGGGGIFAMYGSLSVNHAQITGNTSKYGGGIFHVGGTSTIIDRTTIAGNQAYGAAGASIAGDHVMISASTVSGNITQPRNPPAAGTGGPTYSSCGGLMLGNKYGAPVIVANSTISGNQADMGGGLCVAGMIDVSFTTISNNTSTMSGGGVSGPPQEALQRLRGAERGNGGYSYSLVVRNSVIAGNNAPANPDLSPNGVPTTLAYSLVGDLGGASITDAGGNIFGQPAQLGPLADNGGPTPTHAPLAGSPLVDAGDPGFAGPPNLDQRGAGFPRIVNGVVDIGSIELAQGAPPTPPANVSVPGLGLAGKLGLGGLLAFAGLLWHRRRNRYGGKA